jgi:hypothetical protein
MYLSVVVDDGIEAEGVGNSTGSRNGGQCNKSQAAPVPQKTPMIHPLITSVT